ncbi:MAG: hypothetical protein HY914_07960 [Desulfomonile tiedjei]|nr:hypothetical protein [Desulfomonile tiedjei]
MTPRRIIATAAGALATVVSFSAGLALLIFGNVISSAHLLVTISVALAPLILCAFMVGYAVWWLVLFILTLVLPEQGSPEEH